MDSNIFLNPHAIFNLKNYVRRIRHKYFSPLYIPEDFHDNTVEK